MRTGKHLGVKKFSSPSSEAKEKLSKEVVLQLENWARGQQLFTS
jgi:hypothetical protein